MSLHADEDLDLASWEAPSRLDRRYGHLTWRAPVGRAQRGTWVLDLEPHVAIRAKRVFGRVRQESTGAITISDTDEISADLLWFTARFPLKVSEPDGQRLTSAAARFESRQDAVHALTTSPAPGSGQAVAARPANDGRKRCSPARPARPYQQQAADLALLTGGLLLGDDLGLGKTQSAAMVLADPDTLPAVVVVPAHLTGQWQRELSEIWPDLTTHIITSSTPVKQTKTGTVTYDTGNPDVLIITYAKLAGWRDVLAGAVRTVIFDEVHELRRKESAKYQAAHAIATRADRVLGMSATPIFNYGGEVWNIYNILAPDVLGTSSEFFREWGSGTTSTGQVLVKDPRALGRYLREAGIFLRRTRAMVGRELPAPLEEIITVPSDTRAVDAVMGDVRRMAELVLYGTREERFTASGQIDMKLREATGVDKARYVAEFVRLLLESEEKIVLFGWHRAVYDIWLTALAAFQPVLYTGSENPSAKQASVDKFLHDPACRVFICSLRSGAGLDGLQTVASVAVFGEVDWSPAVHTQAIGRLARDGFINAVAAYFLVSEVGSDPVLRGVLEAKRAQAAPLVNAETGDRTQEELFEVVTTDPDRVRHLAERILATPGSSTDPKAQSAQAYDEQIGA